MKLKEGFFKSSLGRRAFALALFLIFPTFASAGSLALSPSSGSHTVGSNFTVNVVVNSTEPMNTAGATLQFDRNLLRVQSVSEVGSIFNMWPESPDYSNTTGRISFGGGMPGSSFQGSGGRIISITFRPIAEGTASVSFSDGQVVYAGDDITGSLSGGSYALSAPEPEPQPDPTPQPEPEPQPDPTPIETPSAPELISTTHSEKGVWTNDNFAEFAWELPSGADAVRLSISEDEEADPDQMEEAITEYRAEDLEDGFYHFTVQFRQGNSWSEVARYPFGTDTQSPKRFDLEVDHDDDLTNPVPLFRFKSEDEVSGLDYYRIILNEEEYELVDPETVEDRPYQPSPLPPKSYSLVVEAVDMAGNSTLASESFRIEPIDLQVFDFQTDLKSGDPLIIEGTTLPEAIVRIYFRRGDDEFIEETRPDQEGDFYFREVLPDGTYQVRVRAEDDRGALSEFSEERTVQIEPDRLILILSVILVFLILIGIALIWYLKGAITEEREKKMKKRNESILEIEKEAYDLLEAKIKEQIKYLEEKVDLSRGEARLLEELKETLELSEVARGGKLNKKEDEL